MNIAPYKVCIVLISNKDEKQKQIAEQIYTELQNMGIETILDDRDERPGVKFNDMDLIGIPLRITVGKKVEEGLIELKQRKETESELVKLEEIKETIKKFLK
mgnify:FL=1